MIWFLIVHITALLFWGAALLYIPALIAAGDRAGEVLTAPGVRGSMARFIFTNIASPAALLAIMAGTAVFLIDYTATFWLLAKLTLAAGLVTLHALTGLFLLKVDDDPQKPARLRSYTLAGGILIFLAAILFIVLAKPATPFGLEDLS